MCRCIYSLILIGVGALKVLQLLLVVLDPVIEVVVIDCRHDLVDVFSTMTFRLGHPLPEVAAIEEVVDSANAAAELDRHAVPQAIPVKDLLVELRFVFAALLKRSQVPLKESPKEM